MVKLIKFIYLFGAVASLVLPESQSCRGGVQTSSVLPASQGSPGAW